MSSFGSGPAADAALPIFTLLVATSVGRGHAVVDLPRELNVPQTVVGDLVVAALAEAVVDVRAVEAVPLRAFQPEDVRQFVERDELPHVPLVPLAHRVEERLRPVAREAKLD